MYSEDLTGKTILPQPAEAEAALAGFFQGLAAMGVGKVSSNG